MERHAIRKRLGSYTIDQQLIDSLITFFYGTLPRGISPDLGAGNMEDSISILATHAGESILFNGIGAFRHYPLIIDELVIRLEKMIHTESGDKAIVLQLSFGKEVEDNYLNLALQDVDAKARLSFICWQLLEDLAPHRNSHSRYYPNEGWHAAFFVVCAVFGTLAFAFPDPPYAIVFGLAAVAGLLGFTCITLFGYSSFDLAKQAA